MDDDLITFFVIFAAIMIGMALGLNALVTSTQPLALPSSQVLALMNNDPAHKQIITLPTTVAGVISDSSSVTILFYAYNPLEVDQRVNITWWVTMQLDKNYIIATLNGTPINDTSSETFALPTNQTKECLLSFSLKEGTDIYVKEQFKNAGNEIIHFDMKSELIETK